MALDYTALITPQEVRRAAFGTLGDAIAAEIAAVIDGEGEDLYQGVVEAIHGVTAVIEQYLNRQLIIRAQTLRFCDINWKLRFGYENADGEILQSAYARQWPVVEVVSVDTDAVLKGEITIQEAFPGSQLLSYDLGSALITEPPFEMNVFAGYRRADQGVSAPGSGDSFTEDLTDAAYAGLSLTVDTDDIPLLPHTIRRVALRLTIAEIREEMLGLVGVASFTKQADRMVVEGRRMDHDIVERELATLHPYRFVPQAA